MPFYKLFYHFVWATKRREPLIMPEFEAQLYSAIAAKVKEMNGIVHAIGGMEEHVHLATSVPPKLSLATFIGEVKGNSSHFVNHVIVPEYKLYWQDEYGVLSFAEKSLPSIVRYIKNQKKHHSDGSIRDNLERFSP
ncbi:MAG: IS200/IS605 family transposase [Anaerolineae bacterium]|jgi:putative transposase|nr:IS200/IS605 family transposase [Anaerolineae bacterium]MBT7990478.1 IS200/IS605 family transposase [Anaerolineae bacterium]